MFIFLKQQMNLKKLDIHAVKEKIQGGGGCIWLIW